MARDIAAHSLQFHKFALALYREVEHTLHLLVVTDEGDIIDRDSEFGLAKGVEFLDEDMSAVILTLVHAVVHLQGATLDTHFIVTAGELVVIVIVLMGKDAETVLSA